MTKKQIAFTLIELLVVIAIIGILSGLIIVTMSGVNQKANIAKSQVFSNSLRNALMINLVSEWKFDDGSGVIVTDSWNGGNTGSLVGFSDTTAGYGDTHTAGWMSTTNCVFKTCLEFSGVEMVNVGVANNLKIGNSGTISVWIYPTLIDGNIRCIYTSSGADVNKQPYIQLASNFLRIYLGNTIDGVDNYQTAFAATNQWSHIAITWDGTKVIFYINGIGDVKNQLKTIQFETTSYYSIGDYFPTNHRPFVGRIDTFSIFNSAVQASQIEEQYYSGLNNLFINGGITKEEYLSRINSTASK